MLADLSLFPSKHTTSLQRLFEVTGTILLRRCVFILSAIKSKGTQELIQPDPNQVNFIKVGFNGFRIIKACFCDADQSSLGGLWRNRDSKLP